MAYIEKRVYPSGKVTYRARIRINGMPDISATFNTKTHAKEWALSKESTLLLSRHFPYDPGKRTVAQLLDHYLLKELPKNPKAKPKQKQLLSYWYRKLGRYYLSYITPALIAEARDELLSQKTHRSTLRSPSTVNRYLAALSTVFTTAIKDYGWLNQAVKTFAFMTFAIRQLRTWL